MMHPFLFILPQLLTSTAASSTRALSENPLDHYCGSTWPQAAEACSQPCPGGQDEECGGSETCFGYTGCNAKLMEEGEMGSGLEDGEGENVVAANKYCGVTWLDAMSTCSTPCGASDSCPQGQRCQLATNCHVPKITVRSDLMVTMQGPDRTMDPSENDVFGSSMNDVLAAAAAEKGIQLAGVDLGEQNLAERRFLWHPPFGRWLNARVYNVTQRYLPSGSSALDVSMVVTGDYRPPPYLDFDAIAEDSINRQGEKVISTLKERGSRAGSQFFDRVSSVEAVARAAVTQRPTKAPTVKPTPGPTGPPTAKPSMEPSFYPSDMPSLEPSRTVYNTVMTGSQNDLMLGGSTTSSYGFLFNMRTKPEAGVTLLTGIDFYTHATDEVTFSLYSRLGNFQDFKDSIEGWDLIAEGTVKGRGVGRYTSIPEEMFTAVDIPGGGATRAFYLTMSSINLVYKTGLGDASDSEVVAETPDIEIWDGEGVLSRNLPDPSDPMASVYFRYPRQFLGAVYYDRLPCKPFSSYGRINELPCPTLPTQSPSLPQPSLSPVTSAPTRRPVSSAPVTPAPNSGTPAPITPTETPTFSPTLSRSPSFAPSTSYPTGSPIVPMRANIVVNLRNVPERPMVEREYEKFVELLTKLLNKYMESNTAIEGMTIWHQQQVFVDAPETSTPSSTDYTKTSESNRKLLEEEKKEQIIEFKKNQKEQAVPQSTAMQITLILKISFSFIPEDLLSKMAVVVIQEHDFEFIMSCKEQSAFYTYFKTLDGVTADVVLELTPPPTPEPTTHAHFLSSQQEEVVLEEKGGFGFGAMVGLAVGFLWLCLTGCSVFYLIRARTSMKEQRDLEDLLKQEKASSPLDTDSGESETSIPLGNDDNNSISKDAELSILEKKKLGVDITQPGIYEGVEFVQQVSEVEGDGKSLATEAELSILEKKKAHHTSKGEISGRSHTILHHGSLRKSTRGDDSTSSLKRSGHSQIDKRKKTMHRKDFSKSMAVQGSLSSSLRKTGTSDSRRSGTTERNAFSKSMTASKSPAKPPMGKSVTEKKNCL